MKKKKIETEMEYYESDDIQKWMHKIIAEICNPFTYQKEWKVRRNEWRGTNTQSGNSTMPHTQCYYLCRQV